MAEQWTEWFEHDGKGCPCVGMYVRARFDEGWPRELEGVCTGNPVPWNWDLPRQPGKHWGKVVLYRIRRPRALLQLIEMVENLPERRRVKA